MALPNINNTNDQIRTGDDVINELSGLKKITAILKNDIEELKSQTVNLNSSTKGMSSIMNNMIESMSDNDEATPKKSDNTSNLLNLVLDKLSKLGSGVGSEIQKTVPILKKYIDESFSGDIVKSIPINETNKQNENLINLINGIYDKINSTFGPNSNEVEKTKNQNDSDEVKTSTNEINKVDDVNKVNLNEINKTSTNEINKVDDVNKVNEVKTSTKGKIAYNNGEKVIYRSPDSEIPEGFVKGGLSKEQQKKTKGKVLENIVNSMIQTSNTKPDEPSDKVNVTSSLNDSIEKLIGGQDKSNTILTNIEKTQNQSLDVLNKIEENLSADKKISTQESEIEGQQSKTKNVEIKSVDGSPKQEKLEDTKKQESEPQKASDSSGGSSLLDSALGAATGVAGVGALGGIAKSAGNILSKVPFKGGAVGVLAGKGIDLVADAVGKDTKTGAALDVASDITSYASTGAMIGSVIPGVGTVAGGVFGGIVGGAVGLNRNWGTLFGGGNSDDEIVENFSEYDLSMNDPETFKKYNEYKKQRTEELSKEKPKDEAQNIAKREAILKFAPEIKKSSNKNKSDKKTSTVEPKEIKTVETSRSEMNATISESDLKQNSPETYNQYSEYKEQKKQEYIKSGDAADVAESQAKADAVKKFSTEIKSVNAGKVQQLDTKQTKEVSADRASQLEQSQDELDRIVAEKQQKTQTSESNAPSIINNNNNTTKMIQSRQATKNDDFSFNRYIDKSFFA